jgi:hypothetical protein
VYGDAKEVIMKIHAQSGVSFLQWIAVIAVLVLLIGCSRFGDVTGPQSSDNTEVVSDTFEPVMYNYPEEANYAPEGYQLINIHVKSSTRLDYDYEDDYDFEWVNEWYGELWRGVVKRIDDDRGGRIGWDGSGIIIPGHAMRYSQHIYLMRTDPPEPWIDYGPHGLRFYTPVTIRISYRNCVLPDGIEPEDLILFYWNEYTGEYELISEYNNLEEQYLEGQTNHFSRYIVAVTQ